MLHEVGIMTEVEDHPNAVQLFEVYDEPKQYYLVMEVRCPKASLGASLTARLSFSNVAVPAPVRNARAAVLRGRRAL